MRSLTLALMTSVLLSGCSPQTTNLLISEFLILGENKDWIEIYNPTNTNVTLKNWKLTDDPSNLSKWTFPSIKIAAHSYLIVWTKGQTTSQDALTTNFKLSPKDDYLALIRPNGSISHSYRLPQSFKNISYGLKENHYGYFNTPTPGDHNTPLIEYDLFFVQHSVQRGVFTQPFQLELTSTNEHAVIRYTTDNSWPSENHGHIYQEPISITGSTVVKSIAYTTNTTTTQTNTQTYLFIEDILSQPQDLSGFPDTWTHYGLPAHYEMDPSLTREESSKMVAGLNALPFVSISFDHADLFENSLYWDPQARGKGTTRPVSFEYFNSEGRADVETLWGGRIHGDFSRSPQHNPKHGFRLTNEITGGACIENTIFENSEQPNLCNLILRANFQDSIPIKHNNQAQYIRDSFLRQTYSEMGYPVADSQLVHVFLNGAYWGIYDLIEPLDEAFAEANHPEEGSRWDFINRRKPWEETVHFYNSGKSDADRVDWNYVSILAESYGDTPSDVVYSQIEAIIDINNLIDYAIVNIWAGNNDWHIANWVAYKSKDQPNSKFKFTTWDGELILRTPEIEYLFELDRRGSPGGIHLKLLNNPDYRMQFLDRISELTADGGPLGERRATARYRQIAASLEAAIYIEAARWGNYLDTNYAVANWAQERENILVNILPNRSQAMEAYLHEFETYSTVKPPYIVVNDNIATFINSTSGAELYFTIDGSDPRLPGGAISPNAIAADTIQFNETTQIHLRAKQGAEWSPLVKELLSTETVGYLKFSEVNHHSEDEYDLGEYIRIQNLSHETISLSGFQISGDIIHQFPSNAIIEPFGQWTIARNALALQVLCPSIEVNGLYSGRLNNTGGDLTLKTSTGVVLDSVTYGSSNLHNIDGLPQVLYRAQHELSIENGQPQSWETKEFCANTDTITVSESSQLLAVTGTNLTSTASSFISVTGTLGEFGKLYGYRVTADDEMDWLWVDLLIQSVGRPDRTGYFAFVEGWNDHTSIKGNSINWVTEHWPSEGDYIKISVPVQLPLEAQTSDLPINLLLFSNQDGGVYAEMQDINGITVDRLDLGTIWLSEAIIQRATPSQADD